MDAMDIKKIGPIYQHRNWKLFVIIALTSLFVLLTCYYNSGYRPGLIDLRWRGFCNGTNLDPINEDVKNSFLQTLTKFNWDGLISSYREQNNSAYFRRYGEKFFEMLQPFLTMPPMAKLNSTCLPPKLSFPKNISTCRKIRGSLRKIGMFVTFAFDADTLEIYFNELDAVVDTFFLLESTTTYFHNVKKPLLWPTLMQQSRFVRFKSKVVHFVIDDSLVNYSKGGKSQQHSTPHNRQRFQEEELWQKFLIYNEVEKYFQDDDILGFGDLDEVPSRDTLHFLKQCVLPSDPIDSAIWLPYGLVNRAFQTDYPVKGLSFTFAAPTYWTLKTLINQAHLGKVHFRKRGKSESFIFGGMHMSDYGYVPFQLAKLITKTEGYDSIARDYIAGQLKSVYQIIAELEQSVNSTENIIREIKSILGPPPSARSRLYSLSYYKRFFPKEFELVVKLPWFYNCNRDRYPSWEGDIDPRLIM